MLLPLINKAIAGKIQLLFGDAVHLIHGAELGSCWCIERQEIKTSSGRSRFNVMGAYNPITQETEIVTNDTYITSTEIVELFKNLREKNGDKIIYIILDNAKYQKCELVRKKSEEYNINIEYLPAYSPNLNLIERLWKWLRKKCLRNKYRESFQEFCCDIKEALSKTGTEYKEEVASMLTLNFQILG